METAIGARLVVAIDRHTRHGHGETVGGGQQASNGNYRRPARAGRGENLGRDCVALLNQYGKNNQAVYVQGIVQYTQAKAKFDGLIEQLKADLIGDRDPGQSPDFQQALMIQPLRCL
ncbi:MAG: hypothetical protein EBU46_18985 [Nitrosomonadaceae bacterium]|nr:hypothetical protein [Nitrosomonadaceae bacterium]